MWPGGTEGILAQVERERGGERERELVSLVFHQKKDKNDPMSKTTVLHVKPKRLISMASTQLVAIPSEHTQQSGNCQNCLPALGFSLSTCPIFFRMLAMSNVLETSLPGWSWHDTDQTILQAQGSLQGDTANTIFVSCAP